MKNGYINKLLYEARLAIGLDRKEASKLLHMTSIHLKLIEKGYVSVPKKKHQLFIQVYNLRSNFFRSNSNYIADIDKPDEHPNQTAKFKKFVANKGLRIASAVLVGVNAGLTGYGIYCLNKHNWNPTSAWSGDFRKFWTQMKDIGTQSPSIMYPGDTKYTIKESKVVSYEDGYCDESLATFGKEVNAADTTIQARYYLTADSQEYSRVTKDSVLEFNVFVYNKKRLVYSSFLSGDLRFSITSSLALVNDDEGTLSLRPFSYTTIEGTEVKTQTADVGSDIHNEFTNIFNFYIYRAYENFNIIFKKHSLIYDSVHFLVKDLKTISRDATLHFRMGIWFTILGTIFLVGFGFILALSFYFYYQHKKKGTYITRYKKLKQPDHVIFASYPKYKKDLNVKLFIPEFVLIIIGLSILLLSQIAVYLSITYYFKSTMITKPTNITNIANNLLIAGVTLLFFVKLDTYAKKSIRQLLISIFIFIFGGFAFYVAEIVLYTSFSNGGSIFDAILKFLSGLLPGNFIWPLALYAALFLFLFTTPSSKRSDKNKILRWRLWSIAPTILLLFSLIWKYELKNIVNAPVYISCIFFSKGTIMTVFILVYVYILFFYQRWCKKHMGEVMSTTIFFNSRRYFLSKNAIAAITLTILLIVDLCFRFLYPSNQYEMGNNWAIGIIIPFVLFYHPHIGIRNAKWDIATVSLKGIFTVGGYIAAIIEVLTYMNFGELFFILN